MKLSKLTSISCLTALLTLSAANSFGVTTNFFASFQNATSMPITNVNVINAGTAVGSWSFAGLANGATGCGVISSSTLGNRTAVFGHTTAGNALMASLMVTNWFISTNAANPNFPLTVTNDAGSGTRVFANFATPGQFTGSAQTLISFKLGAFGNGNTGNQKDTWVRGLDAANNEVFELLLVAASSNVGEFYVRAAGDNTVTCTAGNAATAAGNRLINNLPSTSSGTSISTNNTGTDPTFLQVDMVLTNGSFNVTLTHAGLNSGLPQTFTGFTTNSGATSISKLEFSQSWNTNANTQNKGFWVDDVSVMDGPPPPPSATQYLWTGSASSVWDVNGAINWQNLNTASASKYFETNSGGTVAVFDDSSAVNTVSISTNVQPASLLFSNATAAYTLGGTGVGGAAQIIKYNAGNVTLTGVNTNTGGVTINGGSIIVSNDFSLGGTAAQLTLAGGTLEVTANLTNTRPIAATANSVLSVDSGVTAQFGGTLASATAVTAKDGPGTLIITNGGSFRFHGINGTVILDRQAVINNNTLGFSSIGLNSGSDATMIIRSNAQLRVIGVDFNVGDNLGSRGQLYIQDNAVLSARDLLVGKFDSGTTGLVYQTSGVFTNANPANIGFLLGGNSASGFASYGAYYLSGGRADILGNLQVGGFGTGEMFITGGAVNIYSGFPVVGRNLGGNGNLVVSGGAFNNFSTNNAIIGEQGTGTLTVTNTGVVNMTQTPLRIGGNGAANVGTGTINLDGGQLATTALIGAASGSSTFNFNGGTLRANTNSSAFMTGLNNVNVLAGGAVIDDGGFNITAAQSLTDGGIGGGLTKLGAGTLTISGDNNTFTGPTVVSNGTLIVRLPSVSSAASLAPGVGLGVMAGTSSGATWSLSSLTLPATNTLVFAYSATSVAPSGPMLSATTVNASGTHTVNVTGIGWPVGTTTLLDYGSIVGGGTFTFGALPAGVVGYLTNNPATTAIELVVTFSANQRNWYGNNGSGSFGGLWDISTTANWTAISPGDSTYADNGTYGDSVIFDSSVSPNLNVELPTAVHPVAVLVTNASGSDFVFYGPGKISGIGSLTKDSNGNLILNQTNDYTGGTFLRQGSITLNTNNVLPVAGIVTLGTPNQGANLVLNGFNQTIAGLVAGGSGSGNRRVYNGTTTPSVFTINTGAGVTNTYNHTLGIAGDTNANNFSVVISGAGQQRLGACNYAGTTTVNGGALYMNGVALPLTNTITVNTGATFGGSGSVGAPVIINSGATLSPGNNGVGVFVISNNLTLASGSTTVAEINKAGATLDVVTNLVNVNYDGTLIVTNTSGTAFANGDTFQLFTATGTKSGNFSSVVIQPATGATGAFNPTTGELTVSTTPMTPTNLVLSVSGGSINLSWPSSYLGWSLQVQTNSLNAGLGTNWVTVPGSSLVTSTNFPIVLGNPTVFYRMYHP